MFLEKRRIQFGKNEKKFNLNMISMDREYWIKKDIENHQDKKVQEERFPLFNSKHKNAKIFGEEFGKAISIISKNFPIYIERRTRFRNYVPGDIKSCPRGGIFWNGTYSP